MKRGWRVGGKGTAFESTSPAQHSRNRFTTPGREEGRRGGDAVGDGGIADLFVPVSDRHRPGEYHGSPLIPVVADFQKITRLAIFQRAMAKSSSTSTSMRESFSSTRPMLPSTCATARSRNSSVALLCITEKPSRHAFCASAHANQLLPMCNSHVQLHLSGEARRRG